MDKSLFDILVSGGWVMIPILLCSIAVIAIGWNRFSAIRAEKRALTAFVGNYPDGIVSAEQFTNDCLYGTHSVQLMYKGIREEGMERQVYVQRLETAANGALFEAEKGLGALASLAAVAPMLGFLGTVTGMISAFMQIQSLGGNVNANVLAGGIWEALVTTAAGLAVGIPTVALYNYLTGEVKSIARLLEECSDLMLSAAVRRDSGSMPPPASNGYTPKKVVNLPNPYQDDPAPSVKVRRFVPEESSNDEAVEKETAPAEEGIVGSDPVQPLKMTPVEDMVAQEVIPEVPLEVQAEVPASNVEVQDEPQPVPPPPTPETTRGKPNWRRKDDGGSNNPLPFRSRVSR